MVPVSRKYHRGLQSLGQKNNFSFNINFLKIRTCSVFNFFISKLRPYFNGETLKIESANCQLKNSCEHHFIHSTLQKGAINCIFCLMTDFHILKLIFCAMMQQILRLEYKINEYS